MQHLFITFLSNNRLSIQFKLLQLTITQLCFLESSRKTTSLSCFGGAVPDVYDEILPIQPAVFKTALLVYGPHFIARKSYRVRHPHMYVGSVRGYFR